jgi:hypothetical protein
VSQFGKEEGRPEWYNPEKFKETESTVFQMAKKTYDGFKKDFRTRRDEELKKKQRFQNQKNLRASRRKTVSLNSAVDSQ